MEFTKEYRIYLIKRPGDLLATSVEGVGRLNEMGASVSDSLSALSYAAMLATGSPCYFSSTHSTTHAPYMGN